MRRCGQQLLDEERHAVTAVDQHTADAGRQLVTEARASDCEHFITAQWLQRDRQGGPPGRELAGQVGAGPWLAVAQRRHDAQRHPLQVVDHVLEHGERLGVCPLQVLHHQQRTGAVGSPRREQPKHRLSEH